MLNSTPSAVPALDVDRLLGGAVRQTPEQELHRKTVGSRSLKLEREMMGFAAVGAYASPSSRPVLPGVYPLGSLTYLSVRRIWARPGIEPVSPVAIVVGGYRAGVRDGVVVVGGPWGNVCAHDLRYRPFPGAKRQIMSSDKPALVRRALDLDQAVEQVVKGVGQPASVMSPARYWAAFDPARPPVIENCVAARRLALEAVTPRSGPPPLPSVRSPGGVVTGIFPDAEGGTGVGFGGTYEMPEVAVVLPPTAVLRPYLRVGASIAAGAALADFLPHRLYPTMRVLAQVYGEPIADRLMAEAVAQTDTVIDGLHCRLVELCPNQIGSAVRFYEDIRGMESVPGVVPPQVVRYDRTTGLVRVRDGIVLDFEGVFPGWAYKFRPRHKFGRPVEDPAAV